jgi:hypothetical protein
MEKNHIRTTKKNLRNIHKTLIPDQDHSKAFSMEELVTALQSVKLGKAGGFAGIYPANFSRTLEDEPKNEFDVQAVENLSNLKPHCRA